MPQLRTANCRNGTQLYGWENKGVNIWVADAPYARLPLLGVPWQMSGLGRRLWNATDIATATPLGQKTQIYDFPNVYGPAIACSSSCNPLRDSAYSLSMKGNA